MKSIDDVKKYLEMQRAKTKEFMLEYKKYIATAYSSDGLYFGDCNLSDVDSFVRSYNYYRNRLQTLNIIYDDLFDELKEED